MDINTYLSRAGAETAVALAAAIGVNPDQVRQWRHRHAGRRPDPRYCVSIERATAGMVTRQELRPDDWHRIWPELIGTEGAPPVASDTPAVPDAVEGA